MQLSFLGATGTVTGSCFLLQHGSTKFLVDCGLYQGNKELKERNYVPFSFNPGEIDFVLLTHAHIDPVSYTHLDVYKRQIEVPFTFSLKKSNIIKGKSY